MLLFTFSEIRTIRQTTKAFNRIDVNGADRERHRDARNLPKLKRFGRKFSRPLKVEDAFRTLIKQGIVSVERRRGKPPLITILKQPEE